MKQQLDDLLEDLNGMARMEQFGGNHYTDKKIQPWDAMECWMSEEQFKGFLLGNVIKYLARFQEKGGTLDLEKAKHYLSKLIEVW